MRFILQLTPIVLLISYFFIRYFRANTSVDLPDFFRFFYTDLIFIPVALGIAFLFVQFIKRPNIVKVPIWVIVIQVLINSIVFEYYLPIHSKNASEYTSDPWDVVMYIIGGILFWLWTKLMERSIK